MPAPRHDLGQLAKRAQELACDDPRQVAPELHWKRDGQGWMAGQRARTFTKDRWGVRPDRVVCRPGYTGLYIHGASERGITWLAFLNGDVVPRGEIFKRLLEDLCTRVGLPFKANGNGHRPAAATRKPPRVWPFTVRGGRFHRYPGYWVCVLPPTSKADKKVVQFRQLADGTVAPGLDAGRFWRSPKGKRWYHETDRKKPPERAEWRELPKVPRRHTYRAERVQPTKAAGGVIYFLEGEKDVETAEQCDLVADTNPGGAGKLTAQQARPYRGAAVVVIPDHDTAGIDGARRNAETLAAAGARVKLLEPLGGEAGSGFDFTDWAEEIRRQHPDGWKEQLGRELARRAKAATPIVTAAQKHEPWSIEIRDFLAAKLAPRQWIIRHLIQQKDIAMIYAKRGVGKTYAAQAIAWAVVTGGSWLRFEVDRPTGVLYVDGEMPREDLHTRFAILEAGSPLEQIQPLRLLSPDIRDRNLPSLATPEGQRIVEGELAAFPAVGLVIIDAVSTLCNDPHANESDAKSWDSMQSWLLSLRRRGIATLVIHHSGKGGDQRGTSKREDVMTQVLRLEHPQDYRPQQGARFELHFVKARGVVGEAARSMEVRLEETDGVLRWSYQDLEGSKRERARRMLEEGLRAMDIVDELDVSRATAFRWQKQWRSGSD